MPDPQKSEAEFLGIISFWVQFFNIFFFLLSFFLSFRSELPVREPLTVIDPNVVSKMTEFGFDEAEVDRVLKEAIELELKPTELHPIRMIYYLTREKIERDRAKMQAEVLAVVGTRKRASVILSE